MNKKSILKTLRKEGEIIVPNSFNTLFEKIKDSDQYIAFKIKKEGEQLVPNNYSSIKKVVKQNKQTKKVFSFKERFVLIASACALAGIIAIPSSIMIANSGNNPSNDLNITPANIKLSIKSSSDNKTATSGTIKKASSVDTSNEIELRYSIDEKQYIDTDSYLPITDGAKIALAYQNKTNKLKVDDFTNNIISTSEEQEIIDITNSNMKLEISGVDKEYGEYLKKQIKDSLPDKYQTLDIITNNEDENVDSIKLAKGYELGLYVKTLFYIDDEPIEGYVPDELLDKEFDEQYWIDFVNNYQNEDELNKIIDKLKTKYNELQTNSNIVKFQHNIEHMYEIYEERYEELEECIEEINEYINYFKTELGETGKEDSYYIDLLGDSYITYDLTLNPHWWTNDFINEQFNFDEYRDFYFNRPNDDDWERQPKPDYGNANYPHPRFNIKLGYEHDRYDEEGNYEQYILCLFQFRNEFEKLQYTNIKCFSFTFDILPKVETMLNNEGKEYDDEYWDDIDYDGPGEDYEDWDDYWKDYHNHGRPHH